MSRCELPKVEMKLANIGNVGMGVHGQDERERACTSMHEAGQERAMIPSKPTREARVCERRLGMSAASETRLTSTAAGECGCVHCRGVSGAAAESGAFFKHERRTSASLEHMQLRQGTL